MSVAPVASAAAAPTVAVVIPTLDRPDDVRRCLTSLLAGERLPAEILVVDQSLDDGTLRVVEEIGAACVRHVFHQPASQSGGRNRGAEEASSDYAAFIDDDAEMPPGWLSALTSELVRFDGPDALYGEIVNPPGHDAGGLIAALRFDEAVEWRPPVHPGRLGWGGHMVVRRSTCLELGGFDTRLGPGSDLYCADDLDFNYRLLKAGGRAVSTPAFHMVHHHAQWRDPDRLPAMWYRYSLGNAAFMVKYLRRGDPFAAYMLARQAASDLKMLVGAVRSRSRLRARIAIQRVRGTRAGVAAGWKTFRDTA